VRQSLVPSKENAAAWKRPLRGAVQRYQTEAPPALPAWLGSPLSLVAPILVPLVEPLAPDRRIGAG